MAKISRRHSSQGANLVMEGTSQQANIAMETNRAKARGNETLANQTAQLAQSYEQGAARQFREKQAAQEQANFEAQMLQRAGMEQNRNAIAQEQFNRQQAERERSAKAAEELGYMQQGALPPGTQPTQGQPQTAQSQVYTGGPPLDPRAARLQGSMAQGAAETGAAGGQQGAPTALPSQLGDPGAATTGLEMVTPGGAIIPREGTIAQQQERRRSATESRLAKQQDLQLKKQIRAEERYREEQTEERKQQLRDVFQTEVNQTSSLIDKASGVDPMSDSDWAQIRDTLKSTDMGPRTGQQAAIDQAIQSKTPNPELIQALRGRHDAATLRYLQRVGEFPEKDSYDVSSPVIQNVIQGVNFHSIMLQNIGVGFWGPAYGLDSLKKKNEILTKMSANAVSNGTLAANMAANPVVQGMQGGNELPATGGPGVTFFPMQQMPTNPGSTPRSAYPNATLPELPQ